MNSFSSLFAQSRFFGWKIVTQFFVTFFLVYAVQPVISRAVKASQDGDVMF